MKRLENLITGLTGVLSARVVVTPLGEVSEVHVLTKSDVAPKQVVRNIESALMAQLGFKIDHRKISVAQAEEVGTDTTRNRVEAAARAATTCLDDLLPDNSIALEGASIIDAFDRKFVLVAVHGLGGREAQLLTGTCEIRESAERSAVLAVLDATNRWTDARR